MHQFDFMLVTNETPTKLRQVEKGHLVIETHDFDRIYMFLLTVDPRCAGQLRSLE
jgi:hypothetical protein